MTTLKISKQQAKDFADCLCVREIISYCTQHTQAYIEFLKAEALEGYDDSLAELSTLDVGGGRQNLIDLQAVGVNTHTDRKEEAKI